MDNGRFFIRRLTELRKQKGVSARDMSISIGQNVNYVNHIETGKGFPSMSVFFALCDYLDITPGGFFDPDTGRSAKLNKLITNLKKLDDESIDCIAGIVKRMI